MPSGVQVFNEKGSIVVDTIDTAVNLSFIKKTSINVGSNRYSYTASSRTAVIAVAVPNGSRVKIELQYNISASANRQYIISVFNQSGWVVSGSADVYEYDSSSNLDVSSQKSGIQAFNSDGKLCYSTLYPSIRVIAAIFGASVQFYSSNPNTQEFTSKFQSSIVPKKVAILFFSSSTASYSGYGTKAAIYVVEASAFADMSNNQLVMRYQPYWVGAEGEGNTGISNGYCSGMCMAIDVTGL